ncbi:MAG: anti-sigma factor antagonist [Bacillota bacterium]
MEINGFRKEQTLIVALSGELDHHSAEIIRAQIDALLIDPGIRELILDMKNVTFMDSSGLGVILGRYRKMAERGGNVGIRNASASVDRVLRMSGLYSLVQRVGGVGGEGNVR